MSEKALTKEQLYQVAEDNNAYEQMGEEMWSCLAALIDDRTVITKSDLSEYMDINRREEK